MILNVASKKNTIIVLMRFSHDITALIMNSIALVRSVDLRNV